MTRSLSACRRRMCSFDVCVYASVSPCVYQHERVVEYIMATSQNQWPTDNGSCLWYAFPSTTLTVLLLPWPLTSTRKRRCPPLHSAQLRLRLVCLSVCGVSARKDLGTARRQVLTVADNKTEFYAEMAGKKVCSEEVYMKNIAQRTENCGMHTEKKERRGNGIVVAIQATGDDERLRGVPSPQKAGSQTCQPTSQPKGLHFARIAFHIDLIRPSRLSRTNLLWARSFLFSLRVCVCVCVCLFQVLNTSTTQSLSCLTNEESALWLSPPSTDWCRCPCLFLSLWPSSSEPLIGTPSSCSLLLRILRAAPKVRKGYCFAKSKQGAVLDRVVIVSRSCSPSLSSSR